MIRIKFIARQEPFGEFVDECTILSLETAETEIRAIVKEFNAEERRCYGKRTKTRYFVRVLEDSGVPQHNWGKVNLTTQKDKLGYYDLWRCSECKLECRVRSLDQVPRGGDCFPDRTCPACQKVFKTEANLSRHIISKAHQELGRMKKWLK